MGCSYGPVPIIPDINHKIRSSVFVGADAPLVVEVSSPSWAREHKIRVRQHLAYVRKIGAHLGMPVQNMTHGRWWKLDSPPAVVDAMVGEFQWILPCASIRG